MTSSEHLKNRTGIVFLLIFIFLAAGVLAGGYFAYQNYEQNIRTGAERQLSAIADLKVKQLAEYRRERLGDASTFFKNPAFSNLVRQFFGRTNDGNAQRQLQAWLAGFQSSYNYSGIFLLDTRGGVRLSVPEKTVPIESMIQNKVLEVLRSGVLTIQDFHRNEHDQKVYLTILVPIADDTAPNRQLGVLLLRIDPEVFLYPFIQTWPLPSRTAETLILRREGNDVVFLNELRFQKDAALRLRFPLSNQKLPAAQAALGHTGIMEGVDYRGESVISALRSVPESPWFLVARVDRSEVYEPIRARMWLMIILVCSLMIASWAGVGLVWRHQRDRFSREQYRSAEALRQSEDKFKALFDLLPIGVSVLDEDRRIASNNPTFEKILELTREGLERGDYNARKYLKPDGSRMTQEEFASIRAIKDQSAVRDVETGVVMEDGRVVWTSVSAVPVALPDWSVVVVTSDITDRKRAEEALRKSEIQYRSLFENSPEGIAYCEMLFVNDQPEDFVYLDVNQSFESLTGLHAVKERKVSEVIPGIRKTNPELFEIYGRVALGGMPERFETSVESLGIWFSIAVYSPKKGYFVAIFDNITERKRIETELRTIYDATERSRLDLLSILEDQKRGGRGDQKAQCRIGNSRHRAHRST